MRTSKQLGQALWGASECRSGRSSHLLSTPAVQSAGRVAIPSQPLWPLACASALPGEAVSVHGAPPRSLLTPRGQLTTHAISSAPQKALCMPPRHITRLFPVGGGGLLGIHLLQTRSPREATSVICVSSRASRKRGPMWVSSLCRRTRCKGHIQAEEASEEGDMSPRPQGTRIPCEMA